MAACASTKAVTWRTAGFEARCGSRTPLHHLLVRVFFRIRMRALEYRLSPLGWMVCKALGAVHSSSFLGPLSSLRLVDRPAPQLPGAQWLRVHTILGGICGTDLA